MKFEKIEEISVLRLGIDWTNDTEKIKTLDLASRKIHNSQYYPSQVPRICLYLLNVGVLISIENSGIQALERSSTPGKLWLNFFHRFLIYSVSFQVAQFPNSKNLKCFFEKKKKNFMGADICIDLQCCI